MLGAQSLWRRPASMLYTPNTITNTFTNIWLTNNYWTLKVVPWQIIKYLYNIKSKHIQYNHYLHKQLNNNYDYTLELRGSTLTKMTKAKWGDEHKQQ